MFDHCHFENINSHNQNHCFKKLTNFRRKKQPQRVRLLEGGGVEKLFGKNPFEQHLSFHGSFLRSVCYTILHMRAISFQECLQDYFRSVCKTILRLRATLFQECVQYYFRIECNTILGMCTTLFQDYVQHYFRSACNTI